MKTKKLREGIITSCGVQFPLDERRVIGATLSVSSFVGLLFFSLQLAITAGRERRIWVVQRQFRLRDTSL
jgi:hypothetical protein